MKVYTKIVIDIETAKVLHEESFEYEGEVALCNGGKGDSDSVVTVRYASYVENKHKAFLNSVRDHRIAVVDVSPFSDFTDVAIDVGFFGASYTLASYPSMMDMFGKFMAGLDIGALFGQTYEDTVGSSEVNALVSAEAELLEDDIEAKSARFDAGMLDIGAVQASSFIVGKSIIEATRVKAVAKFSAELKYRMIIAAIERWRTHLEWNKNVIGYYSDILRLYFSAKMDIEDFNYSMAAKDSLWPFTVLDYERAAVGALQGATKTVSDVAGASTMQKALAGGMGGAAAGALVGAKIGAGYGWQGAVIGGVIGFASAYV